jgi:hypothetical protein
MKKVSVLNDGKTRFVRTDDPVDRAERTGDTRQTLRALLALAAFLSRFTLAASTATRACAFLFRHFLSFLFLGRDWMLTLWLVPVFMSFMLVAVGMRDINDQDQGLRNLGLVVIGMGSATMFVLVMVLHLLLKFMEAVLDMIKLFKKNG